MKDAYDRNIDYMRISVTDRCNLRCRYCMPNGIRQVPMHKILTFEEIRDIVEAAAACGICHIKLTGGEPLVRLGMPDLIRMIHSVEGIRDVTMTTNGVLLSDMLPSLLDAGLDAVNVSLDTLDPRKFQEITGSDHLADVLRGIDDAAASGIPVKINVVPQAGINDDEWKDLALLARDRKIDVRFIELMPIGLGKTCDSVPEETLLHRIRLAFGPCAESTRRHGNGPAHYYRIPGFRGSIGFISAVHGKFCANCNRIRVTSRGKVKPCLCYGDSLDLMPILRQDESGERSAHLREALEKAIFEKPKAHCFDTAPDEVSEKMRMSDIGG